MGWQLSVWTVTGSQTAFSGLLAVSQAALEVFCSHNTLASERSSREATNCPLRKMLKAKWIGDEWCRKIGLATLLCGPIPRLLGAFVPFLYTQHGSQNAFLQIISFTIENDSRLPLVDNLFNLTGALNENQTNAVSLHKPLYP